MLLVAVTAAHLLQRRWGKIMVNLKGDYVIMRFWTGFGPLDDTARARRNHPPAFGIEKIYNPIAKRTKLFIRMAGIWKYIRDAKKQRAIPIVLFPILRNDWKEGVKVIRSSEVMANGPGGAKKEKNILLI